MKVLILTILAVITAASPVKEKHSSFEEDPIGYLTEEATSFLDDLLGNGVKITKNGETSEEVEETRSNKGIVDTIEGYIKSHDAIFELPTIGVLQMQARSLDESELNFKLKLNSKEIVEGRKSKLKKILTPILVFILLKAMTVVPLALGALLWKAVNALQLSIFSFVISAGLAIFQLCKKIAENNAQAKISSHGAFEGAPGLAAAARSVDVNAQKLAYSGYVN